MNVGGFCFEQKNNHGLLVIKITVPSNLCLDHPIIDTSHPII